MINKPHLTRRSGKIKWYTPRILLRSSDWNVRWSKAWMSDDTL